MAEFGAPGVGGGRDARSAPRPAAKARQPLEVTSICRPRSGRRRAKPRPRPAGSRVRQRSLRPPRSTLRAEASISCLKKSRFLMSLATFGHVAVRLELIYKASLGFFPPQDAGLTPMASLDSFKSHKKLNVGGKTYHYFSLKAAEKNGLPGISRLPFSMKVLLENLLRFEDGRSVTREDILAVAEWLDNKGKVEREIAFRPARVLMQDFTGVPAVVDLAAMRDAMTKLGGDPQKINPLVPVDLVIDHSVIVDAYGSRQGVQDQCRSRIRAQRRALSVLEMGARLVRQFPRRTARHRHLPSGQSRISRPDGLDAEREKRRQGDDRSRLSGFARRHRFAHHDGQRPLGARLGRRRHRG